MIRRIKHRIQKMLEGQTKRKAGALGVENQEQAKHFLRTVEGDARFFVNDGAVVASMQELAAALKGMAMKTFVYHANHEKNDFSAWVQDVLGDTHLAQELLVVISKREAVDVVRQRIHELERFI